MCSREDQTTVNICRCDSFNIIPIPFTTDRHPVGYTAARETPYPGVIPPVPAAGPGITSPVQWVRLRPSVPLTDRPIRQLRAGRMALLFLQTAGLVVSEPVPRRAGLNTRGEGAAGTCTFLTSLDTDLFGYYSYC